MKAAADNPGARQRRWIAGVLALLTLVIYAPVRNHDFIDYDDNCYVYQNPLISQGVTLEGIRFAFLELHGAATYWHPVTWLSHMVDCEMFGVNPGPQHLVNVVFHAINVVLLFLWLTELTGRWWRSGAVAMLFAWHPLQVDTVAWIAERKNLLSAMFWILALWSHTRWVRGRRRRDYLAALGCYAIGLMCKPAIVTLPCVLLLLDFWPLKRAAFPTANWLRAWRPLVLEKLPFLALTIGSSLLTLQAHHGLGNLAAGEQLALGARVANAFAAYALYLHNVLWPLKLAVVYPLVLQQPGAWVLAGVLVVLVPLGIGFYQVRAGPQLAVGWCWFLGTLVPTIGVVQAGHQALADRFAYVPVIGIFIAVVWSASEVATRLGVPLRQRFFALAMLGLACLSVTTRQLDYWVDSQALFERALAVTPNNWIARNVLGMEALRQHEIRAALVHLTAAERLYPGNPDIQYNLGLALAKSGRFAEAEAHYATALRLNPRAAIALHGLGLAALYQGRTAEAQGWFRKVLTVDPNLGETRRCLDLIARGATQDFVALAQVETALAEKPEELELRLRAAELLVALGRLPEAAARHEGVFAAHPDDPRALTGLALLRIEEGRDAAAVVLLERALGAQPQLAEAQFQLGRVRERAGQTNAALALLQAATQGKPTLASAWTSLGQLRAELGDAPAALDAWQQAARLRPADAQAQWQAGLAAANLQRATAADFFLRAAARLRPDWPPPLEALAWLLATHPNPAVRQGAEAVTLARRACELTAFANPASLDVLAAALAEAGDFGTAETVLKNALALANSGLTTVPATDLISRLELYRARKAYQQPVREPAVGTPGK